MTTILLSCQQQRSGQRHSLETNLWVNPQLDYVQAQVDGQTWIISKERARKLEFLNHKVEIIKTLKGSEIIGWKATNPLNKALSQYILHLC